MNLTAAPPSSVELEVERIRALTKQYRFREAFDAADALRPEVPENRDVLYLIAICQRQLGQMPDALSTLEQLEKLHPRFSRLYQERGHCYVAMRAAPRAIEAFLRAVNINPALPASWSMLEGLYRLSGDSRNALTASQHVATLQGLPPEIVLATSLFSDGELTAAENIPRKYLLTNGNHIEAMRLLARIGLARDVLDDAELLLEAVVTLAPDYRIAHFDYALVLLERHKYREARTQLEQLMREEPDNPNYGTLYATACVGLGEHDKAIALYRQLLPHAPQKEELHLLLAHAYKAVGKTNESIKSYRAAAASRPRFGDAYWSLANLKTYRFTDVEIAQMRADEAAPRIGLEDRYHMCFALGKALEARGEYAESFAFYERGNALKKSESRYRPEPLERNARLQAEVCTGEFFDARQGVGSRDSSPIFIVGLPRSGSTLLEQILASHTRVEGTMELADIPRMVQELQGRETKDSTPRYPGILAELKPEDFMRLGEKYLADSRVYRTGKPFFIDKMPNNFRHLGLIHLILPNAKIIDARRDPLACCFS